MFCNRGGAVGGELKAEEDSYARSKNLTTKLVNYYCFSLVDITNLGRFFAADISSENS
jgi:hypothetical protein